MLTVKVANSRSNSSCRSVKWVRVLTTTWTICGPRPSRNSCTPHPRSVSRRRLSSTGIVASVDHGATGLQCRHQGCLGKGNRYLAMNLRTATLEELVGSHMDDDIKITGWPAVTPFLPFASLSASAPHHRLRQGSDESFLGSWTTPTPRHSGHGSVIRTPSPRQVGQVVRNVKNP